MVENQNNKKKYSHYFFIIILLFFISLLSFNLVRTYIHYISVKNKVNNIVSLVNKQKKNNANLEKQYKYYTSSYYKDSVASNDLNLIKANSKSKSSSEIILPKNSTSTYVNISLKKKNQSNYAKPSLVSWLKILF